MVLSTSSRVNFAMMSSQLLFDQPPVKLVRAIFRIGREPDRPPVALGAVNSGKDLDVFATFPAGDGRIAIFDDRLEKIPDL